MRKPSMKSTLTIEEAPPEKKPEKKQQKLGIIQGKRLKTMSFRFRPEAIEAAHFMKEYLYQKTHLRPSMTQVVESLLMWGQKNPVKMKKIVKM